jgi:hypothetical protein
MDPGRRVVRLTVARDGVHHGAEHEVPHKVSAIRRSTAADGSFAFPRKRGARCPQRAFRMVGAISLGYPARWDRALPGFG